jgi:hypothetical protein
LTLARARNQHQAKASLLFCLEQIGMHDRSDVQRRCRFDNVLELGQERTAQHHWDLRALCGFREHEIAPVGRQCRYAHRRCRTARNTPVPKEICEVSPSDIDEHARQEVNLVEYSPVFLQRAGYFPRRRRHKQKRESGRMSPGGALEFFQAQDISSDEARKRPVNSLSSN